jgi:hypothetical protein
MKSTGLFGKNSGRVGGVVYSNYRGQQIVRSYQPQVKNPSTAKQVEQRAKFKLVSQVGSVFGNELKNSYIPETRLLSSRNSWMKKMLQKTTYENGAASLPIEAIELTNATMRPSYVDVSGATLRATFSQAVWDKQTIKMRVILISYTDNGEIRIIKTNDISPSQPEDQDVITFTYTIENITVGGHKVRILAYAYEPKENVSVNYEDYDVNGDNATLENLVKVMGVTNLRFSETVNQPINYEV